MNKWKIGIVILIASLLIINFYALNKEKNKIKNQKPEKVYVGYSEQTNDEAYENLMNDLIETNQLTKDKEAKQLLNELIETQKKQEIDINNFNKSSAVQSLQNLFLEVGKDLKDVNKPPAESIKERLDLLDNDNTDITDVLTEQAIKNIYFSEDFQKDKFNRQFAASSLLIYYDILTNNESKSVLTIIENFDDLVYLDARFMTAHIPLDLFIGGNTGISFEMQYVDGTWKLNPYTAMQSLNLMSILKKEN